MGLELNSIILWNDAYILLNGGTLMLGDKKAKQIIQDIETIKCMIEKTALDIKEAGILTRFYLHQNMARRDIELIRRCQAQVEMFTEAVILFPGK